jgi:hypothetical protein
MLQARALIYAVVVSLLIAIVSGLLVSLSFLFRVQQIDQFSTQQSIRNVNSGITLLLEDENEIYDWKQLPLFSDGEDKVVLRRMNWGLFDVGIVRSMTNTSMGIDTLEKSFFIGVAPENLPTYALYMKDLNHPLKVVGSTKIYGNCYLPKGQYEKGHINAKGAVHAKPIEGEIYNAEKFPPKVIENRIKALIENFSKGPTGGKIPKQINHPFTEETLFFTGEFIELKNNKIKGNVVIVADKIKITSATTLENVLLFAKEIEIVDKFKGNIQAFATQKITVGKDSHLSYPSVLGSIRKGDNLEGASLLIESNTVVEGVVFSKELKFLRKKSQMRIEDQVEVKGQIYCEGSLDLRGQIRGSVLTHLFSVKTAAAVNDHFIMDGKINRTNLPTAFVGPIISDKNKKYAIAKWIN